MSWWLFNALYLNICWSHIKCFIADHIRDTFIRTERLGEAVQFERLRPLTKEELKRDFNFVPPSSTAQSPITSAVFSDPGFSVSQTASPCPQAHTSATNIPSTIPSSSHFAMNHPSLVSLVSLLHDDSQELTPQIPGKPTLQFYNILHFFLHWTKLE